MNNTQELIKESKTLNDIHVTFNDGLMILSEEKLEEEIQKKNIKQDNDGLMIGTVTKR